MKRLVVTAIACGVWLSGVTSAAALTYVLDRPLEPSSMATYQSRRAAELVVRPAAAFEDPSVKVGRAGAWRVPAPVARPVEPSPPRDITDMTCAPPRELDMGRGHVQICE
jgi:hypothetical protein